MTTTPATDAELIQYFHQIGIDNIQPPATAAEAHANIVHIVLALPPPTTFTDDVLTSLWSYRIPEISEDGSCSLVDELQPEPFLLSDHLYRQQPVAMTGDQFHSHTVNQWRLKQIVDGLMRATGVQWLGIYQRRHTDADGDALIKLAYDGEPSRPIFPINEEFLAKSSNSLTAHTNKARTINDTRARAADVPYYECSGKVRSESCLPIIDPSTGVNLGIIDAESWKPAHANSPSVMWYIGQVCCELARTGLLGEHHSGIIVH